MDLTKIVEWALRAQPVIDSRGANFSWLLSFDEDGIYIKIDTASTSAFESTSVKIHESGKVETEGDSMGLPDFLGHARGGEIEYDMPPLRLMEGLWAFLESWSEIPKEEDQ